MAYSDVNELGERYDDKFKRQLGQGNDFENRLKEWLNSTGIHDFFTIDGYNPDWDLKCNHCQQLLECKTDLSAMRTGNFYIEAKLLNNSKAHKLLYEIDQQIYMFRMRDLRKWVKLKIDIDNLKAVMGGDRKQSKGYLMPVKESWLFCETIQLPAHLRLVVVDYDYNQINTGIKGQVNQ